MNHHLYNDACAAYLLMYLSLETENILQTDTLVFFFLINEDWTSADFFLSQKVV